MSLPRSRAATLACLAAASLALNLTLVMWSGIRTGGDTIRYTEGAAKLAAGLPLEGMERLFAAYIGVLAASTAAGLGEAGVIGLQILVAALATIALCELGSTLSGPVGGLAAAALFVLNIDIARWHAYVLTDSLYISLVVVAAYAIHVASERGGWWYASAVAVVVASASLRPQGRLLAIVAAGYWVVRRPATTVDRRIVITCAAVLVAGVVLSSRGALESEAETPGQWLGDGVVVWRDPASNLSMPRDAGVDITKAEATSTEPLRYVLRHPLATARLGATRVGVELWHARRFYSRGHNVTVVGLLGIVYALALIGVARVWREPLARLLVAIVCAHLLMVAATFADWDGRFLLYVLPLIGLFAAAGLTAAQTRVTPPAAVTA